MHTFNEHGAKYDGWHRSERHGSHSHSKTERYNTVQYSTVRTDLLMDMDMKRQVDSRVVRMDLGPFASSGSASRSVN